MNDNRNMILAIVLSALVLIGWTYFAERWFPVAQPSSQQAREGPSAPDQRPRVEAESVSRMVRAPEAVLSEAPRVRIRTPHLQGSINLRGARFDDLVMLNHRRTMDPNSPPVRLLSPAGTRDAYFANFGWVGQGIETPDANSLWTASAPTLSPGKPVILSWSNATGQSFQLIVAVDEGYLFTIRQHIVNRGSGAVGVRSYGLASRARKSPDPSMWTMHIGPMGFFNEEANYGLDWETLDEAGPDGEQFNSRGGWLGFTDKYWLTALVPPDNAAVSASFKKSPTGAYQADYLAEPVILAPGQAISSEAELFAGAKEKVWLDRYETAGIEKLSKSIDWGWFEWFMRPIFNLLNWLFKVTGNFGVAIICLTFIVRLLMFPIADKQFRSFAGMRRIQPKMKAIQEKYKDDKPKLQQEMLKLYQQEKINPAAGCLPILLQIPVFYALYKVLMVSVEMRHQPFALWINDLSAPDPLTPVNLFGLLPFQPPAIIAIGVLPILLGITMWIQFKLNPQQMDPIQQKVFGFMPWVLMFIMAPFAAGLQLYWVVSNVLTIAQQWWLYKRYDLHLSDTHPVKT